MCATVVSWSDSLTSRNPLLGDRSNSGLGMICPTWKSASSHPAPRVTRPNSSEFAFHSRTLPAMSYMPKAFMTPWPTRRGAVLWRLLVGSNSQLASRWWRYAARNQCVEEGRLLPTDRAYAAASYQLTPPTGKSSCPAGNVPPLHVLGP